jgi:hypothetical protein
LEEFNYNFIKREIIIKVINDIINVDDDDDATTLLNFVVVELKNIVERVELL